MSLNSMASNRTGLPSISDDIAEMQIAVDAADKAAAAALAQERDDAVIGGAARSRERVDLGGREDIRVRPNASVCSSI